MFPQPIIIHSLILLATLAETEIIRKVFDSSDIHNLNLKNTGGKINITVAQGSESSVEVQKQGRGENCVLKIEKINKTLVLATESPFAYFQPRCNVDFNIKIPRDIALNINNGSGLISINGTRGSIKFFSGSGQVRIAGDITDLKGSSPNGAVSVVGLSGNGQLKVGKGDISITYSALPSRGGLNIRTEAGNATVFVPAGARINTKLKVGRGKLKSELADNNDAPFTIAAKSGRGNLSIKKIF